SSVSGSSGSVPASVSSVWSSPSSSRSHVGAVALGTHASSGASSGPAVHAPLPVPSPSHTPSSSESGSVGSVPASASSALVRPSASWSQLDASTLGTHGSSGATSGPAAQEPPPVPEPSHTPSASVSGTSGLVPS